MRKIKYLCENYTSRESTHLLKDYLLWGSFTKDYKIFIMVFKIIYTFSFFKAFYSHMIFLQVLITTNNTKLLNANYESKILITSQNPEIF